MSETRALTAALSGPVFDGAASRSALHASERHAERWAPEGESARRTSGMRSLAFADRVATPWMSTSNYSRMTRMFAESSTGHSERAVPQVSWLFPRPWFQDELDWMASARQGLEASQRRAALTTRGTFVSPASSSEASWAGVAMPVLSADAMASVAPSMSHDDGSALRAWSPGVDFAAAAAAEVMAGALSSVASAGLPAIAERSPIWGGLSMVTARALAPAAQAAASSLFAAREYASSVAAPSVASPSVAAPSVAAPSLTAPSPYEAPTVSSALQVESARSSIARIEAQVEALRAAASPAAAPTEPAAASALAETAAAPSSEAATSMFAPSAAAPSAPASDEGRLAAAAYASPAASGALRTVELLLSVLGGRPAATAAESGASGASAAAIEPGGAAASAPAMAPHFAPAAGPRVAMPAGLGGLVQSIDAASAVARPMLHRRDDGGFVAARAIAGAAPAAESMTDGPTGATFASVPAAANRGLAALAAQSFAPAWSAPMGALASVASSPARSVDHLGWSDRWLARFAGASPLAMSAFDSAMATTSPELRPLNVGAPEVVYVHPMLTPSAIAAAAQRGSVAPVVEPSRGRAVAPAPAPVPPSVGPDGRPGVLRLDDSEAVPDAIFAAIAAAAVAPAPGRAPAPTASSGAAAASSTSSATASSATASSATASSATASSAAPSGLAPEAAPGVLAPVDLLVRGRRVSLADLAAIAAPASPDAGLAAGLASSPMAPALAAVLPLPAAPVFDPRALHGAALTTTYLGGLVARSTAPVGVLAGAPSLAAIARASVDAPASAATSAWMARDLALAPVALRVAEQAPHRTFLTPESRAPRSAMTALRAEFAAAAGIPTAVGAARAADLVAPSTAAASAAAPSTAMPAYAPVSEPVVGEPATLGAAPGAPAAAAGPAASSAVQARALETELVALRAALLAAPDATSVPLAHAAHTPLLSGGVAVPVGAPGVAGSYQLAPLAGVAPGVASPMAAAQARGVAARLGDGVTQTFAMPFAPGSAEAARGEAPRALTTHGRPGSLAEAALSWSVAEERAAANLAFDFVSPELVLAAKVYGLSPGAAAEAVRLAAAGPASIASMATQLDLTLLRAFQMAGPGMAPGVGAAGLGAGAGGVAARAAAPAPAALPPAVAAEGSVAQAPYAAPTVPSAVAPDAPSMAAATAAGPAGLAPEAAAWAAMAADPQLALGLSALGLPSSLGAARLPRGSFLWPPGAVAALGMRALSPDGAAGLPVVALELLAAQAVAELGTLVTAYPGAPRAGDAAAGGTAPVAPVAPGAAGAAGAAATTSVYAGPAGPASFTTPGASPLEIARQAEVAYAEQAAAEVSSVMSVPASVRQRFESIYVALTRSTEGQSLSPSARAARAMSAVAASGTPVSPREAAAATWAVLPELYRGGFGFDLVAPLDRGGDAPADARPGLASLAARAGESLGSFVSPSYAEVRDAGGSAAPRMAERAAPPVYVDTAAAAPAPQPTPFAAARPGRTFGQFGGGEPEIPAWFEAAAQRMFADDRGGGGASAGMSLAQMVLVTAMPQQQIAAATKGSSAGTGGGAPSQGHGKQASAEKPDVEKLAFEVYHEVLHLFDIARKRSGDPFQ